MKIVRERRIHWNILRVLILVLPLMNCVTLEKSLYLSFLIYKMSLADFCWPLPLLEFSILSGHEFSARFGSTVCLDYSTNFLFVLWALI